MSSDRGAQFARAIAGKDAATLRGLLDPTLDFRAMTPRRFWESASADEVVDDIILGTWFDPNDHIDSLEELEVGEPVLDCERVGYRFRITNPDGAYLVEQQAYYRVDDADRIGWLRIMCSGFLALESAPTG
jgi:hypothetical protein